MKDWQPIETAPKDGTWVLLGAHGQRPLIGEWNDRTSSWDDEGFRSDQRWPTHWMPLPDSPP